MVVFPDYKEYSVQAKVEGFHNLFKSIDKYTTNRNAVLDIGAHVGIYAIEYSKLFNVVHSFEPIPTLYSMLEENTKDIGNIKTYNLCASDKADKLIMIENQRNSEINFVKTESSARLEKISRDRAKKTNYPEPIEVQVDAVPIDSLAIQDVGLIKIDTESYTMPVLNGLIKTIEECSPIVHVECVTQQIPLLRNFASKIGYEILFNIDEDFVMRKK